MSFLENLQKAVSKRSGNDLLEQYSKEDKKKAAAKKKEIAKTPKAEDFNMDGNKTVQPKAKQAWEIAADKKAAAKKQASMTKAERRSAAMARK